SFATARRTWRTSPGQAASARTPTSPSRCVPRAKHRSPSRGRTTRAASFIRRLTSDSARRPRVRSSRNNGDAPGRTSVRLATAIAAVMVIVLLLLRAANALAQGTDTAASPSHVSSSRDSLVPASLTADSATRAALASRLPRERLDTVRAFPLRVLAPGAYELGDTGMGSEGRSNAGFIVGNDGVLAVD